MASILKQGEKWLARIRKVGYPETTETFDTYKEAKEWATKTESDMINQKHRDKKKLVQATVGDLVDKYITDISPKKPMGKNKTAVMNSLKRSLGSVSLKDLTKKRLLSYIEMRMAQGAGGVTISIDFTYLHELLSVGERLWDYPVDPSIVSKARKYLGDFGLKTKSKRRKRRPSDEEIEQICAHFHAKGSRQKIPMPAIIYFAMATAMRQGEITRISWSDVHFEDKTVVIRDRKDPQEKLGNDQTVPLLVDAFKIVSEQKRDAEFIFPYDEKSISTAFTRAVKSLGINDLHFHDLRHEGTSRLFEDGYRIEEVAIFTGHKDWKMLQRYTHIKAKNLHKDRHGRDRREIDVTLYAPEPE